MGNRRRSATARNSLAAPKLATVGVGFWQILLAFLFLALLAVIYRLWFSDTGFQEIEKIEQTLAEQRQENIEIAERNRRLAIEIEALKNGTDEIETRAREDLGLVKSNEEFYLIVEE